jgi:Cysteine-rich CPXCG
MLSLRNVRCPYCGETFDTNVDTSGGDQQYIEDCYVCCRPIVFNLATDADGNLAALETRREED